MSGLNQDYSSKVERFVHFKKSINIDEDINNDNDNYSLKHKTEKPQLYINEIPYDSVEVSKTIFEKPQDFKLHCTFKDLEKYHHPVDKFTILNKKMIFSFALIIYGTFVFSDSLFQNFNGKHISHKEVVKADNSNDISINNINNISVVKGMTMQAQDSLEMIMESLEMIMEYTLNPNSNLNSGDNIKKLFTQDGFDNWNKAVKDSKIMEATSNKGMNTFPIIGSAKLLTVGNQNGQKFSIYSIPVTLQYTNNNENLLISCVVQVRINTVEKNINKIASIIISEQMIDRL